MNGTSKKINPNIFIYILLFCVFMVLGYIMLLNFQPWRDVAKLMLKGMTSGIPFYDAIVSIPFIGGLFLWISNFAALAGIVDILAVGFWGLINGLESLPWFFDTAMGSRIPADVKKTIEIARVIAYVVEAIVCWVRYPCCTGGWQAVMDDAPHWDPNLINWESMITFVIAMFAFEVLLIIARKIYGLALSTKSTKSVI